MLKDHGDGHAGSDSKGETESAKVWRKGGSESHGRSYTGTADAVYASRTGQSVRGRLPANQDLVKGYEFKENWGKE